MAVLVLLPAPRTATTLYRPFDDYAPGARQQASGGTGTSYPTNLSAALYNPAYFGTITEAYGSMTPDGQAHLSDILAGRQVAFLNFPLIGFQTPLTKGVGWQISSVSPYQRKFPTEENFTYYYINSGLGWRAGRRFYMGLTAGPSFSIQSGQYYNIAWAGSFGLLYYFDAKQKYSAGLSVFFPGQGTWEPFSSGENIKERVPSRLQAGFSWKLDPRLRLKLEMHFTDWSGSRFRRQNSDGAYTNIAPDFQTGFWHDSHPHLGLDYTLPWFEDAWFFSGLQTASYFDYKGDNQRQLHLTLGFGAVAGGEAKKKKKVRKKGRRQKKEQAITETYLFEDRLRVYASLSDSIIPSMVWQENILIEKVQITIEYRFWEYRPDQPEESPPEEAPGNDEKGTTPGPPVTYEAPPGEPDTLPEDPEEIPGKDNNEDPTVPWDSL